MVSPEFPGIPRKETRVQENNSCRMMKGIENERGEKNREIGRSLLRLCRNVSRRGRAGA